MTDREDGGPAFPRAGHINEHGNEVGAEDGLSLRDWFAGQALAGMMEAYRHGEARHDHAAHDAYAFADAMIAQRKSGSG